MAKKKEKAKSKAKVKSKAKPKSIMSVKVKKGGQVLTIAPCNLDEFLELGYKEVKEKEKGE